MSKTISSLTYTGTQINYYFVCKRKLWYFSNNLSMEHTSDAVSLGKLIHEESYQREKKEIMIDDRISVDFVGHTGVINEVKKSDKVEESHKYQLLYYLYYLEQKGVEGVKGVIRYPKLRKKVDVQLQEESREEMEQILEEIEKIVNSASPPKEMKNRSFCAKCSYFELCWI